MRGIHLGFTGSWSGGNVQKMCPSPTSKVALADTINRVVQGLGVVFRGIKDGALLFEPINETSTKTVRAMRRYWRCPNTEPMDGAVVQPR